MNSEWALFIVTVVLVLITAWYPRATWVMASRMKQQTDVLIAPRVVVCRALRAAAGKHGRQTGGRSHSEGPS